MKKSRNFSRQITILFIFSIQYKLVPTSKFILTDKNFIFIFICYNKVQFCHVALERVVFQTDGTHRHVENTEFRQKLENLLLKNIRHVVRVGNILTVSSLGLKISMRQKSYFLKKIPDDFLLTRTLAAWTLRAKLPWKLHNFSLIYFNSFLHQYLKSKFLKKIPWHKKGIRTNQEYLIFRPSQIILYRKQIWYCFNSLLVIRYYYFNLNCFIKV